MNIRKAISKDLSEILELWSLSNLPVKPKGRDSINNLKKQMKRSNMWILIAEENKTIIGSVLVTHDSRKGWINRLVTHPTRIREKIATDLLKAAENSLIDDGIEVFAALITAENTPSRTLFEKEDYSYYEEITYYSKRISPES